MLKKLLLLIVAAALSAMPVIADDVEISNEVLEFIRNEAEQGDAKAQFSLGYMYHNGVKVERDYIEAARWYSLGAEQGHAGAQMGLGSMYFIGNGVVRDYIEAKRWFRLSAEQGNAEAQLYLGGVNLALLNDHEGLVWFLIANASGAEKAEEGITAASASLSSAEIKSAEEEARRLFAEIKKRKINAQNPDDN